VLNAAHGAPVDGTASSQLGGRRGREAKTSSNRHARQDSQWNQHQTRTGRGPVETLSTILPPVRFGWDDGDRKCGSALPERIKANCGIGSNCASWTGKRCANSVFKPVRWSGTLI